MVVLNGPRLQVRELAMDDWPAVHAYGQLPEVSRYLPWGPNTPEESRAFVELVLTLAQATPRSDYELAITVADGGQLIGSCGLRVRNREYAQAEIGYALHPDFWGRGYATEAARLLLGFGFGELGLHRIYATCDPRNEASARVLRKLGMTYEGRLRESVRLRDGWRDSELFSILVHEWQPT
jgi:[ribosomal protein S5]-alanine N-acetyltransferase